MPLVMPGWTQFTVPAKQVPEVEGVNRLAKGGVEVIPRLVPQPKHDRTKQQTIGGLTELIYDVPVLGNFPGRKLQKPNP